MKMFIIFCLFAAIVVEIANAGSTCNPIKNAKCLSSDKRRAVDYCMNGDVKSFFDRCCGVGSCNIYCENCDGGCVSGKSQEEALKIACNKP